MIHSKCHYCHWRHLRTTQDFKQTPRVPAVQLVELLVDVLLAQSTTLHQPARAEMSTPWLSSAEAQGMWTGGSRVWRVHFWKNGKLQPELRCCCCCDGFYFEPKVKLNQTKQIGKYIIGEIIFSPTNSHPEGLRHCFHPDHHSMSNSTKI